MRTEKQTSASRENAKKSTGPRTTEGKARASKNALKHGLMAQDAVIPGEDPAAFDRHLTNLETTYLPRNYIEKQIVRQIADTMWRIKRLSRIETTVVSAAIERTRVYQHDFRVDRIKQGHEGDLQLLGESMLGGTKFPQQPRPLRRPSETLPPPRPRADDENSPRGEKIPRSPSRRGRRRRRWPRSALRSQKIRPGPSPAANPRQRPPRPRIARGTPPTGHRLPVGQVSRPARRPA